MVQGSCIVLHLSLVYINDVTQMLNGNILGELYADELKLYTTVRTVANQANVQDALDRLAIWSRDRQLAILPTKCAIVLVNKNQHNISSTECNIGDETLRTLHSMKDLGIIVDLSLKLSEHVRPIVSKIRSRSNMIFKCFFIMQPTYRPSLRLYGQVWSTPQLCGRQRQSATSN